MKKITIILVLTLFHCAIQAQEHFKLDLKKSKIFWKLESMGKHKGYILFSAGSLDYTAKGAPTNGNFVIDMNSIRSTDKPTAEERKKIDVELRKTEVFDVANFPSANMVVKRIEPTENPTIFKVTGNLTIKGITKPIGFQAHLIKNGQMLAAKAEFKIDRTLWNIFHKPSPKAMDFFGVVQDIMVDDVILISLDLTFSK